MNGGIVGIVPTVALILLHVWQSRESRFIVPCDRVLDCGPFTECPLPPPTECPATPPNLGAHVFYPSAILKLSSIGAIYVRGVRRSPTPTVPTAASPTVLVPTEQLPLRSVTPRPTRSLTESSLFRYRCVTVVTAPVWPVHAGNVKTRP